ncbi:MAG: superinfection exclusion B family protein [Deltaproteobacteria bacterium]|nr:superinfection exclusion B family protein [Deltaproteobacteria bacterium]
MLEHIKLLIAQTPRVLLGIVLFCTVAIITPASFLQDISFLPNTETLRQWLYIVLVFCGSLLLSHFLFGLFPVFKSRLNGWVIVHRGKKRLKNLTRGEKKILSVYIDEDTMTKTFECTNGVVLALEIEHIIYRASEISKGYTSFPYNIQVWTRQHLLKNPQLLS